MGGVTVQGSGEAFRQDGRHSPPATSLFRITLAIHVLRTAIFDNESLLGNCVGGKSDLCGHGEGSIVQLSRAVSSHRRSDKYGA